MKKAKKILCFALVFGLVFTSGVFAFSDDGVSSPNTTGDEAIGSELDWGIVDVDDAEALDYVLTEQDLSGVFGFDGDNELPDDGSYVSVIVLFDSLPAPIQVLVDPELPEAVAEAIVEAEHEDFREEAAELFGADDPIVDEFVLDEAPMVVDGDIPFSIDFEYRLALNGVSVTVPADMVYELAALDSVRAVYPVSEARDPGAVEEEGEPLARDEETNDPAGNQPGRHFMNANKLHELGYKGQGVVVCVADGGVDARHPALAGAFLTYAEQLKRTPDNPQLTEAHNIGGFFYGRTFPTGNNVNTWHRYDPRTAYAHGTHVTGTVLGRDTGSTQGILGVAPEAHTFHYRVGDRIAAVEMALIDKPDLCTMSMGANNYNSPVNVETVAYNNALLQNPWLIWTNAANNVGPWYYTADTPDASPLVFAIGNARIDGHGNANEPTRASANNSSGRGPVAISHTLLPQLMSHGTAVISSTNLSFAWTNNIGTANAGLPTDEVIANTVPDTATLAQREPTASMTGCSMAAPHAAGAVALLIGYDMAQNDGVRTWDRREIRARLMNNATWIANKYESNNSSGSGFIDVYAAAMADTVVSVTYNNVATVSTTVNHPNNAANYNTTKNAWLNNVFRSCDAADFSFGNDDSLAVSAPKTLGAHLKNTSSGDRVYSLSYVFRNNPDGAASLALPATLAVPAKSTVDFNVTFNLDKAKAADVPFELYEGLVYVHLGDKEVAHLPFQYVLGDTGFFTLGGGATGNRPVNPAGIHELEVYRPVINTDTEVRQNRASGMLGVNMARYQTSTATLRISRANADGSLGESVTANLNAFTYSTLPLYHGEPAPRYMLDRTAQTALGGAAYTEGEYVLSVIPTSTTQTNVNARDYINLPFDIDNTPPVLNVKYDVATSAQGGDLTVTGNVYDEWIDDAAVRGITFPIVEYADPDGLYISPNLDQSYNAVWIQVGDNHSVRADVDANGDFEIVFEGALAGKLVGETVDVSIWAIDNYVPIPATDAFRTGTSDTNYNWAANALPYYVPETGGFVTDERFDGYVWSGLNVAEQTVALEVPVFVSLSTDVVSYVSGDVEYTVSVAKTNDVLDLELEFAIDGDMLAGKGIVGLNGFDTMNQILWTHAGNNLWKGTVTLALPSGSTTGLTSEAAVDIAKFVYSPKGFGNATMTITSAKVVGLFGDTTKYVPALIENGAATTVIARSKYDLNRDGVVDALDLGIMLLYCGFDADSSSWGTLVKVNDAWGNPVTASMCDVNGDGLIDMLDLLDLFIHYTK
ncbi:MAG: S8 family serine peptidase [Clostridiales bacterium]|nr:S8 family serine peptidase [Clostridiales bacterium]